MTENSATDTTDRQESTFWSIMEQFVPRHKLSINIALHSVIFTLSLFLSCVLGLSLRDSNDIFRVWFADQFLPMLPFFLALKLIFFGRVRLLRGGWRYASIREVADILYASWLFLAVAFGCVFLLVMLPSWLHHDVSRFWLSNYFGRFPKGALFLDFLATVFLVSAAGWASAFTGRNSVRSRPRACSGCCWSGPATPPRPSSAKSTRCGWTATA